MINQEVQVLNQDLIQEEKMEKAQDMVEKIEDLEIERVIEEQEAIETVTAQPKEVGSQMTSPV